MSEICETIKAKGEVHVTIEYDNGKVEERFFRNTILLGGRNALAKSLANQVDDLYQFYINRMVFGDNGTSGGVPKFVDASRSGLFGVTKLSKPVIATIDPNIPYQAVFTSVITKSEVNGVALSEMALEMADGQLYSMVSFADLNKTSSMQITWNWRCSFV
jgi:hypothetical protein